MRFILVEEIDISPLKGSKGSEKVSRYGDKVMSATEKGKERNLERSVNKLYILS